MFGKKNREQEPLRNNEGVEMVAMGEIDNLQLRRDAKEEAENFIQQRLAEVSLEGTHIWRASDSTQAELALATIALNNDRLAELITENSREQEVKTGQMMLPVDSQYFAQELSRVSLGNMDQAKKITYDRMVGTEVDFFAGYDDDESWWDALQPDAQLPQWPIFADQDGVKEWQGEDIFGVSMGFLRGVYSAAKEISTNTALHLERLMTSGDLPEEYAEAIPTQIGSILGKANIDLENIDSILFGQTNLSANSKLESYTLLHDTYLTLATANIALHCPQIYGPDWIPNR